MEYLPIRSLFLREDQTWVILTVDKGVVMDKQENTDKALTLLTDTST